MKINNKKLKLTKEAKQYKEEKYLIIDHNGFWVDHEIEIFKIENITESDINKIKFKIFI